MSTDIHGWVEVRDDDDNAWFAVIDAGQLLDQNYRTFGSLFGVRNDSGFSPIALDRGLPDDASAEVREQGKSPSDPANRAWCHSQTWITWDEIKTINWNAFVADARITRPDTTLRDVLDDSFRMVFEMMEVMARRFGDANVRLVVWFDN